MPKRVAGNQMTQDNWDQEEEVEEEGGQVGMPQASAEMMKGRVIKVARRKGIAGASGTEPAGKSAFSGFGGFGTLKPTTTFSSFGASKPTMTADATKPTLQVPSSKPKENGTKEGGSKKCDEYYSKLRALNESVSSWIKQHVDKNPYCILTPVFRDYEKHLEAVEKLNEGEKGETKSSTDNSGASIAVGESKSAPNKRVSFVDSEKSESDATVSTCTTTTKSTFSFSSSSTTSTKSSSNNSPFSFGTQKTETETPSAPKFSFGLKPAETKPEAEAPKFSFGLKPATETTNSLSKTDAMEPPKFSFGSSSSGGVTSGFSFGGMKSNSSTGIKPFSFATTAAPAAAGGGTDAGGEEEEYVPPKVEVSEVKEEGASYSKRCKLFWMVDGSWKEKGLGNLHLKPLDSGKTQLVMRADTNLGNVILNIMLTADMPTSRSGKNMVNFVCIPNPPFDPKAEPKPEKLLLKVKTSEDADELFEKLNEAKK